MKKIILLITIFCLISSCVYAEGTIWNCEECGTENNLNFCGNCGSPKDVDISTTTSQVHPTPYEAYNEKISEYIAALSMNENDFIALGGDCHSINLHMVSYDRHGRPQLAYVLYDIDYDDIPELVFSNSYSIIDIYTIRDDKLVKVYDDCDYGDRSHLYILPNGTLMTEGANDAFSSSCDISKIDPTTGKVTEPVISYYYDTNGPQDYYVGSLYLETDEYCEIVDFYTAKSIFDNLEWSIIERDSIFTKFFAEAYGDDGAVYAFRLELETARVTDQEIGYPYLNEYDVLYSNGHEASFYVPLNEHNGTEMPFVYGENQDGLYLVYSNGIILNNTSKIIPDYEVNEHLSKEKNYFLVQEIDISPELTICNLTNYIYNSNGSLSNYSYYSDWAGMAEDLCLNYTCNYSYDGYIATVSVLDPRGDTFGANHIEIYDTAWNMLEWFEYESGELVLTREYDNQNRKVYEYDHSMYKETIYTYNDDGYLIEEHSIYYTVQGTPYMQSGYELVDINEATVKLMEYKLIEDRNYTGARTDTYDENGNLVYTIHYTMNNSTNILEVDYATQYSYNSYDELFKK